MLRPVVALQGLGPLQVQVALRVRRALPALEVELVLLGPPLAGSSWPECWSPALPRRRRC